MKDIDRMKALKQRYGELLREHGEEVAEYKAFREALLELNRRHRRDGIQMYTRIIARIEKKVARK